MKPTIKARPDVLRLCMRCGGEEHKPSKRCAFCSSTELRVAKEGETAPTRIFISISHNVWGLGATQEQAASAMIKNWPKLFPSAGAKAQMWEVPRGAYVTMLGKIGYPADALPPVLMLEGVL